MTKRFTNINRARAVNWDGCVGMTYCGGYVEGETIFPIPSSTASILYFLFTKYNPQYSIEGLPGVHIPKLFHSYADEIAHLRVLSVVYDIKVEWDDKYTRYTVLSRRWDNKYNNQGRVVA